MAQQIGIVLAGGAGRRIGRSKGDLVLGEVPLAERAARELSPICGTVLISVGPGMENPAPGFDTVEDAPPSGRGPLAGIAAAFRATGTSDLIVLACDYPRVETPLLREIVSRAEREDDLVFPTDEAGRDHPLVGLWRRSAERALRDALEMGLLTVRALLSDLSVRRLGPRELAEFDLREALLNVNWAQDLEALR